MSTHQPSSSFAIGAPAITPRAQPDQKTGAWFTEDDVATFFKDRVRSFDASEAPVTITKVLFVTSAQASALMQGEFIGRPDSDLLCYVESQGSFLLPAPPFARREGQQPEFGHTAISVFDARTGNLLIAGVGK